MENFYKEASEVTPRIYFDYATAKLVFSGHSIPEDVESFFSPFLDYLNSYAANPKPVTEVVFNFDYYNSASLRVVLDIFFILKNINDKEGCSVDISWYFDADDDVVKENGEDMAFATGLNTNIIPKQL